MLLCSLPYQRYGTDRTVPPVQEERSLAREHRNSQKRHKKSRENTTSKQPYYIIDEASLILLSMKLALLKPALLNPALYCINEASLIVLTKPALLY